MSPQGTLILAIAACFPVSLAACGGSKTSPTAPSSVTPPAVASLGQVDPALVGVWNGSLDGSFGVGSFAMTLSANGSVATVNTGGSSNYCAVNGDWGVSSGQFTARGPDCSGTIVTFTAPLSTTRLSGSWTASSGRNGTFAVTKQ